MRFQQVEIAGVRNVHRTRFVLGPGLNYFYGDNGAGKTALLEAVNLVCRGRSFRTQIFREVLERGASEMLVRADLVDDHGLAVSLAIHKDRQGKTELKRDGLTQRRLSDVARLTPLQTLLPTVGELVFGPPGLRRGWLDWGMFHVKPEYLVTLREYQRVLRQRNQLLKAVRPNLAALAPWTAQLVEIAARVSAERRDYLNQVSPELSRMLNVLAPELDLTVTYQQGWPEEVSLEKMLGESGTREVKSVTTRWGPHRADVVLSVPPGRAAAVLSRGQGKVVATALKLGQASLLSSLRERSSVFLIDDVGSELDSAHSARFFELLRLLGCQILATSANKPIDRLGFDEFHMFHVKQGNVISE
jgi:DNA replication and repair protein RecF